MRNKLYEIPTYENFLKGLEEIKAQQLEAREGSQNAVYPLEGKHYLIGGEGDLSFTGTLAQEQIKSYVLDACEVSNADQLFEEDKAVLEEILHLTTIYESQEKFEDDLYSIFGQTGDDYEWFNPDVLTSIANSGKEVVKDTFPPFSAAELLLDSKNDFKIDLNEAAQYYNLNKEMAMKENEKILSSSKYQPEHPLKHTVDQEIKEVQTLLEENGQYPSVNPKIKILLEQHFEKVEKLVNDFSDSIEGISHADIPKIEEGFKEKLSKIFSVESKEIEKLKKQNAGLKVFVNEIKNKNPETYNSVYNFMKNSHQEQGKNLNVNPKSQKVEEIQL
ncbi:hypothetical protein [Virgibacillus sp. Bac332]|uniref:hypothetical protein n=1 Tax=Virgibacillus sp. Bac332 TaxID=2419842 RepID=UPI000EF53A93|nr:hypothetical protein [Virgibacillus sp. Bac332]